MQHGERREAKVPLQTQAHHHQASCYFRGSDPWNFSEENPDEQGLRGHVLPASLSKGGSVQRSKSGDSIQRVGSESNQSHLHRQDKNRYAFIR